MSTFGDTPSEYLKSTEAAVQHSFLAFQAYHYRTPRPSLAPYRNEDGGFHLTAEQALKFLEAESASMSLDFAKAIICGTIIQVAYTGIIQYSSNYIVPENCKDFGVSISSPKSRFCIGREVHGIPIGLIIYAARVQYNHWEEGYPTNPTAKAVFGLLNSVRFSDPWNDLVYQLDWPITRPVTHHIVRLELGWRTYEDYLADMTDMILQ